MPVNPKYTAVGGVLCYPDVAHLPVTPDLARHLHAGRRPCPV